MNLNNSEIPTDENSIKLQNNNTQLNNYTIEKIEVFFKNLEEALIEKIHQYKDGAIFGSVAWLTSKKIIDALSTCRNVQIVVQKEDFLRPDLGEEKSKEEWKKELWDRYSKLRCDLYRYNCRNPINSLSIANGNPQIDPIRCVGNYNRDKTSAFPRAHNKFLVFCDLISNPSEYSIDNNNSAYVPKAVWTGSFNLTWNATNSLENALYLEDSSNKNNIIEAYLNEHHQIYALSEQLNWSASWIAPEFRIGT